MAQPILAVVMKQAACESVGSAPRSRVIRVVIVDDSPVARLALTGLLSKQPRVELIGDAASGPEGWLLAAQQRPDLVVTDLDMPGFDGLELARRLRRAHPQIKTILTSVHAGPTFPAVSRQHGAEAFIPKEHLARELPALLEQLFPPVNDSTPPKADYESQDPYQVEHPHRVLGQ